MNIPTSLKYTKDHEWVRLEGDVAYVGITDYAQSELGEIVFVDIVSLGETVVAEEVFGTIEAVKTVSDLCMPITGEVLDVNPALEDMPELVNQSPYEDGWIIKVAVANVAEVTDLLSAEAYKELLAK